MAELELFTIVIAGSMNPAIHHPYWYQHFDLISQEELEQAKAHPESVFMPVVAQFATSGLSISCQSSRWEIKTAERANTQRIVALTTKVFDEKLPHTPVNACGFNFIFHRECRTASARLLAEVVECGPLQYGINLASAELKLTGVADGNCVASLILVPAKENLIKLAFNVNYGFAGGIQSAPFLLEPTLSQFADKLQNADGQVKNLLDQLNAYAASS